MGEVGTQINYRAEGREKKGAKSPPSTQIGEVEMQARELRDHLSGLPRTEIRTTAAAYNRMTTAAVS